MLFLFVGLVVLKEVVELGVLLGGVSFLVICSSDLFFSNLEFVYILLDWIVRRLRNVLVRVMNEVVEFEFFEGEVGVKLMIVESVRVGENKGSKEKKKRWKWSLV